jgi:CheY-like chemotaxis protein
MLSLKYNILIVDDHPFTIKILTKILEKQNYNVFSFTNPVDALSFLDEKAHQIDLIISDMMMQEMTGMDLLTHIKRNQANSQIPFVFLSAANNDNIRREAFEKGALDFFDKPVNTNLFVSKIQSILQNISSSHLSTSILLSGNEKTLSQEDILKYCEMENLTGFVYFNNATLEAVFLFKNGVIQYSSSEDALNSDYELVLSWTKYDFIISRSKFNINAAQQYIKQTRSSPLLQFAINKDGKFDNFFSKFPDLIEIFIYRGTWNPVRDPLQTEYSFLLDTLYFMQATLLSEYGKKISYTRIKLKNDNILLLAEYNKNSLAFLLKSENSYSRLLEIWKASQK